MGFYHGFVAQAQDEGKGLVDLTKTLGCGVAHLCSNKAYQQEHAKADRLLNNPDRLSIPQQLNMLWEAASASTRQDWTSGRKAQASGRVLWIGLSLITATKGLSRLGEGEAGAVARLPQDVRVSPTAPPPLRLNRPISASPTQNAFLQNRIAGLQRLRATDIRVNQQQVDINGVRIGINRPDLQYTLAGQRFYEEFDTQSLAAAQAHGPRILANDPRGRFIPWFVP